MVQIQYTENLHIYEMYRKGDNHLVVSVSVKYKAFISSGLPYFDHNSPPTLQSP